MLRVGRDDVGELVRGFLTFIVYFMVRSVNFIDCDRKV